MWGSGLTRRSMVAAAGVTWLLGVQQPPVAGAESGEGAAPRVVVSPSVATRGTVVGVEASGCLEPDPGLARVRFFDRSHQDGDADGSPGADVVLRAEDGVLRGEYRVAADDGSGVGIFFLECGGEQATADLEVVPDEVGGVTVERLAGDGRVGTANAISRETFRGSGARAAVLARADVAADALVAAPLAAQLGGPLLLTPRVELPRGVANELSLLGVEEVVLLGGTEAISAEIERRLSSLYRVRRVAGADRYATAVLVAELLPEVSSPYLVRGDGDGPDGFADALAAAPVAAGELQPVLLVGRDFLPEAVRGLLEAEGSSWDRATIVGGEQAVSQTVEEEFDRLGPNPRRIGGENRYQTSAALVDFTTGATRVRWLATGAAFPDALAAGPAVARSGDSLLLVDGADLLAVPEVVARLRFGRLNLGRVNLLGGQAAINDAAVEQLREVLLQDDLDADPCRGDQLVGTFAPNQLEDGTRTAWIELVNVGAEECTLEGVPGLDIADSQGATRPTRVQPTDDAVRRMPLASGGRDSAEHQAGQAMLLVFLAAADDCEGTVQRGTRLLVTLPDAQGQVLARAADPTDGVAACDGRLTLSPFRGSSD